MTLFRELLIYTYKFVLLLPSIRGCALASLDTAAPTDETPDKTTSHLTNPAKDAGQVIGYSHSTRLPNNVSQIAGYRDERRGGVNK
jgi:hypothetical protein